MALLLGVLLPSFLAGTLALSLAFSVDPGTLCFSWPRALPLLSGELPSSLLTEQCPGGFYTPVFPGQRGPVPCGERWRLTLLKVLFFLPLDNRSFGWT